MSNIENSTKAKNNLNNIKELFGNSDEELDAADVKLDSCVNYGTNFDKWTMHHYYAMKNREKYPNIFFLLFSNIIISNIKNRRTRQIKSNRLYIKNR